MCGFGDNAIENFFQGIYSLASGRVFSVHEMHGGCDGSRLVALKVQSVLKPCERLLREISMLLEFHTT